VLSLLPRFQQSQGWYGVEKGIGHRSGHDGCTRGPTTAIRALLLPSRRLPRHRGHERLRGALSRQSDTGHEETTDHRVANLSKTAQKRVADLQSAILISHGIWRYVLGAIRYASDCRVPPVRLLRVAEVDDFAGTRSHLPNEVYDGLSGLKDMSALHDDVGGIGTECTPLTLECCGFSTLM
jgi:hypothetical protein